ncbi:MAG: phosphatidylglycerophosphatase A family protein [Bacteroidia bacterium]
MKVWHWVVSGGGVGFVPLAPASWASLFAVGMGWLIYPFGGMKSVVFLAIALTFCALYGISKVYLPSKDPKWVVLDEMSMQVWVLVGLPSWEVSNLVAAFVLFRFWDVVKLFPAAIFEDLPAPWGIVLDDAVAAFWSILCLQLLT